MTSKNDSLLRVRTRAHRVLFDKNLPFQPRTEESKKTWKRQDKHKKNDRGSTWW
jgi:hypothetical protein